MTDSPLSSPIGFRRSKDLITSSWQAGNEQKPAASRGRCRPLTWEPPALTQRKPFERPANQFPLSSQTITIRTKSECRGPELDELAHAPCGFPQVLLNVAVGGQTVRGRRKRKKLAAKLEGGSRLCPAWWENGHMTQVP